MANQQLQKTLYILLTTSDSLLSLPAERQADLRKRMLDLPDDKMQQVIGILENEQKRMAVIKRDLTSYASQLQVLTQNLNAAAHKLSRVYAGAQEKEEQEESLHTSEELLKQLDEVAGPGQPKKKKFGIF